MIIVIIGGIQIDISARLRNAYELLAKLANRKIKYTIRALYCNIVTFIDALKLNKNWCYMTIQYKTNIKTSMNILQYNMNSI